MDNSEPANAPIYRPPLPWWKRFPNRVPFAVDHRQWLYRYRSFRQEKDADEKQKGYLLDTLLTGRVYVPSAAQLNDPWEMAPRMLPMPWGDLHGQVADFLAYLTGTTDSEERARLVRELQNIHAKDLLSEFRSRMYQACSRTPVLCFSERADNLLMWSYYAAGHSGYVLEFNAKVLPIAAAMRTKYRRRHQVIALSARDAVEIARRTYCFKGLQWRHEQEWRLIPANMRLERFGIGAMEDAPSGGYYFSMQPRMITGLVFGERLIRTQNGMALARQISRARPDLRLRVAQVDRDRFAVNLRDLEFLGELNSVRHAPSR
jgi:hypothetical protein